MSLPADALSSRTAAGSKSRSIRVRAVEGSGSAREYTIFSAARQISAKSLLTAGWSGPEPSVSQYAIVSYIRRPYR